MRRVTNYVHPENRTKRIKMFVDHPAGHKYLEHMDEHVVNKDGEILIKLTFIKYV